MNETEYLELLDQYQNLSKQFLNETELEKKKEIQKKMKEVFNLTQKYLQQIEIEEFLDEMRSKGAVSLKNQEIKVHKNGAKITIPATYLRDGIIDKEKKYTLIFVPS